MNLPPAVRKDRSPFALLGAIGMFIEPPAAFLGFVRWTSYECPYCGCIFRRDFWPNKLRLGGGKRSCQRCDRIFDDGDREWSELTLTKKLKFLFPPLFVGVWGGLVLGTLLIFLPGPHDEHTLPVVLVFALGPAFLWCPVRLIWVLRSYSRCRNIVARS
jgi:hypothetical protein